MNTKQITIFRRDGTTAIFVDCRADQVDAWLEVLAVIGVRVAYVSCI